MGFIPKAPGEAGATGGEDEAAGDATQTNIPAPSRHGAVMEVLTVLTRLVALLDWLGCQASIPKGSRHAEKSNSSSRPHDIVSFTQVNCW